MVKRSTKPARRAKASTLDRTIALSKNLRWTWHPQSKRLFESLDPAVWEATGHNPILTVEQLPPVRREVLEADPVFASELAACEQELKTYLKADSWWKRTSSKRANAKKKNMRVAYFCMEYGLHEHLPLYSGGLGILAGDHLKSASDLGIPLVAIGMLWRKGYYRQELTNAGEVRILYPEYDFTKLPVEETGVTIKVPIGKRTVHAKVWKLQVGRVPLYLLDTDLKQNRPEDRKLTHHLYGGDNEYRIRQEVLLGVGGLMAL
ncbi:MAG: alpha-glucan family phosphorylase, partial [Phycisphaerales bacterium]